MQRLRKAHADEAEANARYARTQAEQAMRATLHARPAVVFPDGFLDACEPGERAAIDAAMARLGYRAASPDDLRSAAASVTMEEVEEIEAMSARWREGPAARRGGQ